MDPCDPIESFDALRAWVGAEPFPGVLFCMWVGGTPAIALPGEQWRSPNWITREEAGRRAVSMPWRT